MIGLTVGNYKILEQLNGSEKFDNYRAVNIFLKFDGFVKSPVREFTNHLHIAERLHFEAATLAKLVHPFVPKIYTLTTVNNRIYMVTEFLEGETLDKLIRRQGPISSENAVSIFTQILECLEFAHASGVIHGNLKADRIFITEDGNIKILGFGEIEPLNFDEDFPLDLMPENDDAVGRDIYAVGRILFEALTGETLNEEKNTDAVWSLHMVNPVIPEGLIEIIANIFRLETYGKFQKAGDLHRELLQFNKENGDLMKAPIISKNAEISDYSENDEATSCSLDFSPDEDIPLENRLRRSLAKIREKNTTPVKTMSKWKITQRNVWIAGAGISAVLILQFVFQFSFIQSEKARQEESSIKNEKIGEVPQIAAPLPESKIESEIEIAGEEEDAAESEEPVESRLNRRQVVTVKPKVISPPPPKNIATRISIKKREFKETRAQRLRRAEKFLTGA